MPVRPTPAQARRRRAGVAAAVLGLLGVALVAVEAQRDGGDGASADLAAAIVATTTAAAPTSSIDPAPTTSVPPAPSVYAGIGPGALQPGVADDPPRVYVPNGRSDTVTIIDPTTYEVIGTFRTGREPQHVVPSYDLQTLWVLVNQGDDLIPLEADSGLARPALDVEDPYNLYFTPDGSSAVVVAEALQRLDFRHPQTMALTDSMPVPGCAGINHADYDGAGTYALFTCEFEGAVVKVDLAARQVLGRLDLAALDLPGQPDHPAVPMPGGTSSASMPQDVRVGPDGRTFFVADMMSGGVFVIDGDRLEATAFVPTGTGAHGITPSRDGRRAYVANRGAAMLTVAPKGPGSVSVLDMVTMRVEATWPVPGGGSPDMGNLDPTGRELWLSGRYDAEVYVFDTTTGEVIHRIPVGQGPHGLTYWPQPGTRSLGHTGNMR